MHGDPPPQIGPLWSRLSRSLKVVDLVPTTFFTVGYLVYRFRKKFVDIARYTQIFSTCCNMYLTHLAEGVTLKFL